MDCDGTWWWNVEWCPWNVLLTTPTIIYRQCISRIMTKFIKNVMGTIRAKSSRVLLGMVFLGLMYVIYTQILSPIRIKRLRASVSLSDNNMTTEGLFDARVPIQEAFGTEYDSCVKKGYDDQFCLRSENSWRKQEDIPL